MARLMIAIAALALVAIAASAPLNNAYDFQLLVQQWPPGVCQTNLEHPCTIPSDVNFWTLHGLWPSRNDTSYPSDCNKSMPYDKKAIASIRPKLETAWANLFGDSSDDSFWGHEWGRHGTCSLDIVSKEIEYFEAALELRSRYDFAAALSSNGVSPSSSKTYTVNDIVLAMRAGFGADPLLWCQYHKGKGQFLIQVGMCFGKDLTRPFMCDERVYDTGSCNANEPIYYWPMSH